MSFFRFPITRRDQELLAKWRRNIGNNVKFYDEITDRYFEPADDEFNPLPIPTIEGDITQRTVVVVGRKSRNRKTIPKWLKQRLENERGDYCQKCSNSKYHDIHHIDGDATNNDPLNLELLCVDCHRHLKKRKKI